MRIIIFITIYLLIFNGCFCLADVILFKNGERLEGNITEESSDTITIELGYGKMDISRKEIQSIEKKDYVKPAALKEEEKKVIEFTVKERQEAYLKQIDEELAKIIANKIIKKNNEYLTLREKALLQKRDILKKEIAEEAKLSRKSCLEKKYALEYTIGRLKDIWKFDPEYLPTIYSINRALEDELSSKKDDLAKLNKELNDLEQRDRGLSSTSIKDEIKELRKKIRDSESPLTDIIEDHKEIQTLSKEEIKTWVEEARIERTRKIMEFRRQKALSARRLPTRMPAEGEITAEYGQTYNELAKSKRLQQLYGVEGEIQWNQRQAEYIKKLEGVTVLRHNGVDINLPIGTPLSAAGDGRVIETGNDPYVGGNYVVIDHFNGLYSYYGHNSGNLVHKGQHVRRGEMIAVSGNTGGEAFGGGLYPHVHYAVQNKNGKILDPETFWKNNIPVVVPEYVWKKTRAKGLEEVAVGELKGDDELKKIIEGQKSDPKRQIDYFTGLEKAKDIEKGFYCSYVKFNYNYVKYGIETKMQGVIINNSDKDYKVVKFTLLLYGDSGVLETGELTYNYFNKGNAKHIDYKTSSCYLSEIRDYEIKFKKGS